MSIVFDTKRDDGTVITAEVELTGPDASVGLFDYSWESVDAVDEEGDLVLLTEQENNRIGQEAIQQAHERNSKPDPYPGDYD